MSWSLIDAFRMGGIWVLIILGSTLFAFLCFLTWYVLIWMKKNPISGLVSIPLGVVPLCSLSGAMVGLSETNAALNSGGIAPDMKAAMMAQGISISLYSILFLWVVVPFGILCSLLCIAPVFREPEKDKTLPLICGVVYLLCFVLGALMFGRAPLGLALLVVSPVLGLALALSSLSRSPIGKNIAVVATLLGTATICSVVFSANSMSYIEVFSALAMAAPEQKQSMVARGVEVIQSNQLYAVFAVLLSLIPSVFAVVQQQKSRQIFSLFSVLLVAFAFGILFFLPDIESMISKVIEQAL